MRETLAAILDFYRRPLAAPSRAMDECSLLGAAIPAILVTLLVGWGAAPPPRPRIPRFPQPAVPTHKVSDQEDGQPPFEPRYVDGPLDITRALRPTFKSLVILAVVFVPSAILIWVLWQGPGGFMTILMRDYAPTLLCLLFAWTAAWLPAVLLRPLLPAYQPYLLLAGLPYFTFLAACSLRTVMGIGFAPALFITLGAYLFSSVGLIASSFLGNTLYFLASPWFLFYFYRQFQSGAVQLGSGLSSRQNLRRSLAISTLNPRDGDAQYQLGLIYTSRRQYTEAISRFTKAAEIDPKDPAPRYELGRIDLEQKRYQSAFDHFYAAAELDPSHAANAVWRDIGIACFHLEDYPNAVSALDRYAKRREYDPEGLYWLGKALAASNQPDGAADAWRKTVEAAKTMPSHRRRFMSKWAGMANSELKAMGRKAV